MKSREDQLQIAVADYLRWKHPNLLWMHIPNGGSRNVIEAMKLKRMGVRAGVPDIFIPYFTNETVGSHLDQWEGMRYGFFCELKVGKNKPTKIQLEMHEKLRANGYYVCVCYTLDEFIKELNQYLGIMDGDQVPF